MGVFEEMAEESFAYDFIHEMSKSKMDPSEFGLPKKKKYPLNDEKHVKLAIKFFNYVDKEDEEELARNIIKKIKKYNIKDIKYSEKNRFFKYYKVVKEDASSMFCFDEQIITEANIFQTIKEKIKKAIVSFIEMLERLLKKGKESKFKTKLLDILDRAKKNLTKCNDMSTPKEAKECEEELKREQKEFEDFVKNNKNNDCAWEDLENTKSNVSDSIEKRHEDASKIIKDSFESMKRMQEDIDKMHAHTDELLKQMNQQLIDF